jgi:UDP-N-acetylmuramate dehydrogenase
MKIQKNYNLSKLNTFGINVNAKFFVEVKSEVDVAKLFNLAEFKESEKIFLGGGSNILFTKDVNGIVILNKLQGIEIVKENSENIEVRAMGGVIWNDLVMFAVNNGYWGIENLSLIPGTVGAAPIQNIGAYGVELKDTLVNIEAFEIETSKKRIFTKEECKLGYRNSIFKNELKGQYFISAITLKLSKIPKINISYGALKKYLDEHKIEIRNSKASPVGLRPRDISDAISAIRRSKLPDPKIIGNAGSFFKNVFVEKNKLAKLLEKYPDIPHFEEEGLVKIPAGWLIEKCGPKNGVSWGGYKIGNVGVHKKQALVLVNYGNANGGEILELANEIIASVKEKFGLELVPEVNIV